MESQTPSRDDPRAMLLDLGLVLIVMFAVRSVTVPSLGYMGNVLVNSIVTVGVATWRLQVRGVSWLSLGLCRTESLRKSVAVVGGILVSVVVSVVLAELLMPESPSAEAPDNRFAGLEGNLAYLLSILLLVWLESLLEELQDRGFLLNWLQRLFSGLGIPLAVLIAVLAQALMFGLRHAPTHGGSGAVVVGVIGLIFGIAYVASGRNLWPLIIAHCLLNSVSMIERFAGSS